MGDRGLQRMDIARALAVLPEFLVYDAAVAPLAVSIRARILNGLLDLRPELDLTYRFISDDLGVVEHLSDRVLIMYLGHVIEAAPAEEVFANPNHPCTPPLLAEVPRIAARARKLTAITGDIPSVLTPHSGCHFHPAVPTSCQAAAPRRRRCGRSPPTTAAPAP